MPVWLMRVFKWGWCQCRRRAKALCDTTGHHLHPSIKHSSDYCQHLRLSLHWRTTSLPWVNPIPPPDTSADYLNACINTRGACREGYCDLERFILRSISHDSWAFNQESMSTRLHRLKLKALEELCTKVATVNQNEKQKHLNYLIIWLTLIYE